MLHEAVSEICAELRLLSKYASSFAGEHTGSQDDVAMLFSGLSLLSKHAEQMVLSGKTAEIPLVDQDWPSKAPEEELEAADEVDDYRGAKHGWMADVIKDLALYARQNDMPQLSSEFDGILDSVFCELHMRDLQEQGAGAYEQDNVISLGAVAATRGRSI